jgi:hypothetical protein
VEGCVCTNGSCIDSEAVEEGPEFLGTALELSGESGVALGSCGTEDGDESDGFEVFQEAFHSVRVSDDFFGTEVEKPGEEISEDAGEDVDVEFLVGPVELGTECYVEWVLEVCEDGFDIGLASVGLDDFGG